MRKSIEIIPAILPKDFTELEEKVGLIKGFTKTVQVDICDGQFVPNATWPYKKRDDSFENIIHEAEGMPEWKDLNYEFDLMVNRPEEVVTDWVSAGAMRVIIHVEARGNVTEAIVLLRDRAEIGIALNIDTPLSIIEPYADQIQFVQCMGIDNVGFQHQQFDEKVIEKVREVKAKFPHLLVSVDGGVTLESAPKLISAGADRLVVGSAIFNDENPIDAIQRFRRL